MKIGFLLGWPQISGGSYVIYEHASRLKEFGHEVTIITKKHVKPEKYSWHSAAGSLHWLPLADAEKNQFDIVIATWWESPFLLHKLMAKHYVYFVQSIESRFWLESDPTNHDTRENDLGKILCESTYTFNIPIITEAGWIKKYLFEHYNHQAFLVRNGIRKDIYSSEGPAISPKITNGIRVLIEGPVDVPYKNVPLAVELCEQSGIEEVWLLTSSRIKSFPGVDKVFSCVPVDETSLVYRSCDVLLKLSYIEGMFGPPLEMFHCGGTSIVYDVTGHDEYIDHDHNSYVVEKDNHSKVVSCLQRLQNDPAELNRLKNGAKQTAADWHDWSNSSKEFEQSLKSIIERKQTSRTYLKEQTETLFEQHQLRTTAREMHAFTDREKAKLGPKQGIDNFVQFYWHGGDGWSQERCQWFHYKSGDWITASFSIKIQTTPIYLRIDPSVHVGIVELRSIQLLDTNSTTSILLWDSVEDFSGIELYGTFCSIDQKHDTTFFSYGTDPQFLLPYCEKIEPDTRVEVKIVFREMGVCRFLGRKYVKPSAGGENFLMKLLHKMS